MSDARRATFGFFGELLGAMGDLLAGAGTWAEDTARRYFRFLSKATIVFGIGAVILVGTLVIGALTGQEWLISTAVLLIGFATAFFLFLASPIGVLVAKLGREVEDVKKFVTGVGGVLLWAMLLSLYFSLVPVSSRPGAIFLVMLIAFVIGLFWAVYGIGPNPRRIYASVISVFIITTVSFFFPKTFSAAIGLRGRLDEKLAECLTSPSTCFSRQPAQEEVRGVELPSAAVVGGAPQKWYALTPDGVKYYDGPGVDPRYRIPLQPITPELARKLKLLEKGGVKPIDPTQATFFNPITGEPQVWYYQYPDGTLEFYDKPGFHPVTGTPLQAVTQQIYFEWKRRQKATPQAGGGREQEPGDRPPTETRPSPVVLEVRSDPQGADTYLDWKPRGQTPVPLEGKEVKGLLVVVKDGHQARFRSITYRKSAVLDLSLPPESTPSRTRLLLLGSEGASNESISSLRGRLVAEGFTVLGPEEAEEFRQEFGRAGGLSHRGLRAWARARFDTNLLVTARFRQSSRELGEQELQYLGIREAVTGAVRAEVGIDLEVVDLRSGDHLAAVSGKGSSFALDRAESFQKALTQAATDSAKLLRQQIRG